MALVKVPEKKEHEFILDFMNTSAMTYEGLNIDKNNIKKLEKQCRENGYTEKEFVAFWFYGSVMNRLFGLTETNAYSDDLIFVVVPGFYNPIFKLASGARWFDDIVNNNAIIQNGINYGIEPDFSCKYGESNEQDSNSIL